MSKNPSPASKADDAGPAAYPEVVEGSRGVKAGINIEQSRQIGQDPPRDGSVQGKEKDKADPGVPSQP